MWDLELPFPLGMSKRCQASVEWTRDQGLLLEVPQCCHNSFMFLVNTRGSSRVRAGESGLSGMDWEVASF